MELRVPSSPRASLIAAGATPCMRFCPKETKRTWAAGLVKSGAAKAGHGLARAATFAQAGVMVAAEGAVDVQTLALPLGAISKEKVGKVAQVVTLARGARQKLTDTARSHAPRVATAWEEASLRVSDAAPARARLVAALNERLRRPEAELLLPEEVMEEASLPLHADAVPECSSISSIHSPSKVAASICKADHLQMAAKSPKSSFNEVVHWTCSPTCTSLSLITSAGSTSASPLASPYTPASTVAALTILSDRAPTTPQDHCSSCRENEIEAAACSLCNCLPSLSPVSESATLWEIDSSLGALSEAASSLQQHCQRHSSQDEVAKLLSEAGIIRQDMCETSVEPVSENDALVAQTFCSRGEVLGFGHAQKNGDEAQNGMLATTADRQAECEVSDSDTEGINTTQGSSLFGRARRGIILLCCTAQRCIGQNDGQ